MLIPTARSRRSSGTGVPLLLVFLAAAPRAAVAQVPTTDPAALARATQNPVAALTTLPLQFNFNNGGDLDDGTLFNLNFQPVIPFGLTREVNVIARTIVPVVSAPGPAGARYSGIGDIQEQIFFTPARPGALVVGVGPMFSLPTATTEAAETGTFAAGAGGVVVKTVGPFVLGGLLTQLWPATDAGGAPRTNLLTIQPFVNYNFGSGWAVSTAPLMTANWDADAGNEWTVPLGLGVTKTTVFNGRPMNLGFQYYYNVERPDGAPAQQFRFSIALIYPQAPK
jgi:hypothetical protein